MKKCDARFHIEHAGSPQTSSFLAANGMDASVPIGQTVSEWRQRHDFARFGSAPEEIELAHNDAGRSGRPAKF
jgi:hypothetical protein